MCITDFAMIMYKIKILQILIFIFHFSFLVGDSNVTENIGYAFFDIPKCLSSWITLDALISKPNYIEMENLLFKNDQNNHSAILNHTYSVHENSVINFQHTIGFILPFVSMKMSLYHKYGMNISNFHLQFTDSKYFYRHSKWIDKFFAHMIEIVGNVPVHEVANTEYSFKKHPSFVFVHSSDAYRISSHILNKDMCRHVGNYKDILQKPLQISILDRDKNRKIHRNIIESISSMKSLKSALINEVKVNETLSFYQQIELFEQSDILILAHGATEANFFALNPCSRVIELYPYGYCPIEYYGHFYRSLYDVIVYRVHDIRFTEMYGKDVIENCNFINEAFKSNNSIVNDQCNICSSNFNQSMQFRCRTCMRYNDIINVDIFLLRGIVQQAIADRRECIMNSKLYNPNDRRRK